MRMGKEFSFPLGQSAFRVSVPSLDMVIYGQRLPGITRCGRQNAKLELTHHYLSFIQSQQILRYYQL